MLEKCGEEDAPWPWEPTEFTGQHGTQTHIVPRGRREGIADMGARKKETQIGLESVL